MCGAKEDSDSSKATPDLKDSCQPLNVLGYASRIRFGGLSRKEELFCIKYDISAVVANMKCERLIFARVYTFTSHWAFACNSICLVCMLHLYMYVPMYIFS